MTAAPTQLDAKTWTIQGETLQLPVQIRKAQIATSIFRCSADDARAVLAQTPFEPVTVGRSAFSVALFVRYIDGDLGCYDEFGVGVAVRGHEGGKAGVYVLHMPVTAEFTMLAGRWIWGLPKFLVASGSAVERKQIRIALHDDGDALVTGALKMPLRVPGTIRTPSVGWSTAIEGAGVGSVLMTPGSMTMRNIRVGRRGAALAWGDDPMSRDALRLRMHGTPMVSVKADAEVSIDAPQRARA